MSAQPAPIRTEQVSITATAVYVAELVEADPDVIRVVADAADPAEAVHNCLRVGAKALRVANTAVDVDMVERSFDDLTQRLDMQVGDAVGRITDAANGLLDGDEEGVRARVVEAQRALGRLTTIKGAHSKARRAIDQAAGEVAALVDDVEVALAALEAELDGAAC